MSSRTEWRIVTSLWDDGGRHQVQMFPDRQPRLPLDVPDADGGPHMVPFQLCESVPHARTCWSRAVDGLWIPPWATRAHVSAALVYVNDGAGWQYHGPVVGTDDVWLRDNRPPAPPDDPWPDRVAVYVDAVRHQDAA